MSKAPNVVAQEQQVDPPVIPATQPPARNIDSWLRRVCGGGHIPLPPWEFSDRPGFYDGCLHLPMLPSAVTLKHVFAHYVLDLAAKGELRGPGVERGIKSLCGPTFADDDCSHCSNPANPMV